VAVAASPALAPKRLAFDQGQASSVLLRVVDADQPNIKRQRDTVIQVRSLIEHIFTL